MIISCFFERFFVKKHKAGMYFFCFFVAFSIIVDLVLRRELQFIDVVGYVSVGVVAAVIYAFVLRNS